MDQRSDVFIRDRPRQNALVRPARPCCAFTAADLCRPLVVEGEVRACLLRAA